MAQQSSILVGFVGGTMTGWTSVLVMQPFQIIKVRLVNQSLANPRYRGIVHCFKSILKEEGPMSFYKGTLSPLIGYGIQGSVLFGFNQLFKQLIAYVDPQSHGIMPMKYIFLSGLLSGVASALVTTPADHTRIVMQKSVGKTGAYKGSVHAGRDIYRRYGLRDLYLGFNVTCLRQVSSSAIYFFAYEYIMRLFVPEGEGSSSAPLYSAFFAGGLAGLSAWSLAYPLDNLKTVIQSQDLEKPRFKSIWHCAKERYKLEGFRTFYKGFSITMLQSFPYNGVTFLTYEYVLRMMSKKKQ